MCVHRKYQIYESQFLTSLENENIQHAIQITIKEKNKERLKRGSTLSNVDTLFNRL